MPYKTSFFIIVAKTPFSSSLLISLRRESVKGVSYIIINIFIGGGCFIDIFIDVR